MGFPVADVPVSQPVPVQQTPVSKQAADLFNGNSSRSDSESTGVIRQDAGSYNSQVNIVQNSHIGYGPGESHPVPVFFGTTRWNPNHGDYEVVAGVSLPWPTKATKISRDRLRASKRLIEIENRFRTMSGCANIAKAGFVVNYDVLLEDDPLRECETLIASAAIELPEVSDEKLALDAAKKYDKALKDSQLLIHKLLLRIEQLEQENGRNNPFREPG